MKHIFTSKTDLAQAYFPYIGARPARHKLMALIEADKILSATLQGLGYRKASHTFSPAQLDAVLTRLGNPFT